MKQSYLNDDPEPFREGYKTEYTLRDYLTLCKKAFEYDDAGYGIPIDVFNELRYALQHIKGLENE